MKKAFFLMCFINIIASASGQVTEGCTLEKRDFKGYYIIEYKDKELKEHLDEKKSSRMIDFNNQYFIVDRDSFYHAYIKKVIEGKLPYVSVSSNITMLQLIYDYVCADNDFIIKKNLEDTLKSNHYYKIKGLKRKSFRIKYVEGILYVVKIPKKKFLSFFGRFSPEMLLTEPMTIYALVNITAVKELEESQFKFMKAKRK